MEKSIQNYITNYLITICTRSTPGAINNLFDKLFLFVTSIDV